MHEIINFNISTENLTKLPQEISMIYCVLSDSCCSMRGFLDSLLKCIENNDFSNVELDDFYAQWSNAVLFYKSAKHLHSALKKSSCVNLKKENNMHRYYNESAIYQITSRLKNKEQLNSALKFVYERNSQKPSNVAGVKISD
jgi:hypothetical protein